MDQALALLAVLQLGFVTRQQLIALGFGRRMIENRIANGCLSSIHPGIYRVGNALPPTSFEQRLMAAQLAAGDCAISHKAAGVLLGLPGLETEIPEITVPHDRQTKLRDVVVHRTRVFGSRDVCLLGPFRVTTPTRTLIDLTSVLTLNELEQALDDAVRRNLSSLPELQEAIERRGSKGVEWIVAVRSLVRLKCGQRASSRARAEEYHS